MSTQYPPPVTTSSRDFLSLVVEAEGKDWKKPEIVYTFSNDRKFENTDRGTSGIYKK